MTRSDLLIGAGGAALALVLAAPTLAAAQEPLRVGNAAYGDYTADHPGVRRLIRPQDLPPPLATKPTARLSKVVDRTDQTPVAPPGFKATLFADDLDGPRLMRVAPNGDVFVSESTGGKVHVFRTTPGADKPTESAVFVSGLKLPFGISFYPAGPNPQWVYVATTRSVLRYPYRNGDLKARGPAEVIVPELTKEPGNHWARDVTFTPDGKTMLVSVGSADNVGEGMGELGPQAKQAWIAGHALGAAWGADRDRADVLAFTPDGKGRRVYAAGIRNCEGMAWSPGRNDLYCSVNERDMLGDNLVPDYVTRVKAGGFYGWPWYYIGDHEDPRRKGERPDLAGKVTVPDVLIQPHSATLTTAFYTATSGPSAFPAEYRGDAFAALHGSWNRDRVTGYKVVRIRMKNGVPTGEYDDFLTGFVIANGQVWGRPVGVAVEHDGALLVSEDGSNTIWRVAPAR